MNAVASHRTGTRLLPPRLRFFRALGTLALMLALSAITTTGCGGDAVETSSGRGSGGARPGAPATGAAAADADKKREREPLVFKDEDFVESVRNRDPFRSYSTSFRAHA